MSLFKPNKIACAVVASAFLFDIPAQCLETLAKENSVTDSVKFGFSQSGKVTLPDGSVANAALQLSMTDSTGQTLSVDNFGGNVQVTWTIPASAASSIDTSDAQLLHWGDDNTLTPVPATFTKKADGSMAIVFQTTHFSKFVVRTGSGSVISNPKTGTERGLPGMTLIAMTLASMVAAAAFAIKRGRSRKNS